MTNSWEFRLVATFLGEHDAMLFGGNLLTFFCGTALQKIHHYNFTLYTNVCGLQSSQSKRPIKLALTGCTPMSRDKEDCRR